MTSIWEGMGAPATENGDGARVGVGIAGGLEISIGNLASALDRKRRQEAEAIPRPLTIAGQGICPTPTATFGFALGGPTFEGPGLGRRWFLRRCIIGGLTWTTTAAGSAQLYASGLTPAELAGSTPLPDVVDQAATLPMKAFYSNEHGLLQYGQRLCVVIVGGTAGQQYVATAMVLDVPDVPQDYDL